MSIPDVFEDSHRIIQAQLEAHDLGDYKPRACVSVEATRELQMIIKSWANRHEAQSTHVAQTLQYIARDWEEAGSTPEGARARRDSLGMMRLREQLNPQPKDGPFCTECRMLLSFRNPLGIQHVPPDEEQP